MSCPLSGSLVFTHIVLVSGHLLFMFHPSGCWWWRVTSMMQFPVGKNSSLLWGSRKWDTKGGFAVLFIFFSFFAHRFISTLLLFAMFQSAAATPTLATSLRHLPTPTESMQNSCCCCVCVCLPRLPSHRAVTVTTVTPNKRGKLTRMSEETKAASSTARKESAPAEHSCDTSLIHYQLPSKHYQVAGRHWLQYSDYMHF